MIKICIVTHSYPRFEGDWRSNFIESLARAFARNGAAVTVFVPYSNMFDRKLVDQDGVKIVPYRYAPTRSLHTVGYGHSMKSDLKFSIQDLLLMPLLLASGTIRLTRMLRRERFDLMQAHWAVPNTLIAVFARYFAFSRSKVFTSFPGSDVTAITKLGWIGRFFARIIAKSDYLSCNSSDLREDLGKAGIDAKTVDFVIYGVDDNKIFYSESDRAALRAALGITPDCIVMLLIGRFVPKKGFSTAFRALKHITAHTRNIRLIVVGDGPLRQEYDDILEQENMGPYVHFIGEIPTRELGRYYSACDIFLMPSQRIPSDGLNVVVPEAMACGRPIVATNVGGNDLVVFPGVNGFLHAEKDEAQLAACVLKLIDEPELRTKMGNNSLKLVKERFTWDAIARYYLARYQERASTGKGR